MVVILRSAASDAATKDLAHSPAPSLSFTPHRHQNQMEIGGHHTHLPDTYGVPLTPPPPNAGPGRAARGPLGGQEATEGGGQYIKRARCGELRSIQTPAGICREILAAA